MEVRFMNTTFVSEQQEDSENSPENSGGSQRSTMLNDSKMACTSSPKKSGGKRSIQKRVVSVPIKDVEGSRLKGETSAPPSDSWAWRKYGQKPIKGTPYPRGYYRCSSSKGCPARKQVERSRLDPNMLVVTYSCEHNHPWPASRNQNQQNQMSNNSNKTAKITSRDGNTTSMNFSEEDEGEDEEEEEKQKKFASQAALNSNCDRKLVANIGEGPSLIGSANEHVWFSEFECTTSCPMFESPIWTEDNKVTNDDLAMTFTLRDDDESFFADLGELPECSKVFRRRMRDDEHRRLSLTPWCGTTG